MAPAEYMPGGVIKEISQHNGQKLEKATGTMFMEKKKQNQFDFTHILATITLKANILNHGIFELVFRNYQVQTIISHKTCGNRPIKPK